MTREEAIKTLRELWRETNDPWYEEVYNMAIEALSADAVEVVQCKDCKHVGTDATCFLVCNREGMGLRPYHVYHDDFCSYGERREDGE